MKFRFVFMNDFHVLLNSIIFFGNHIITEQIILLNRLKKIRFNTEFGGR